MQFTLNDDQAALTSAVDRIAEAFADIPTEFDGRSHILVLVL